MKMEEKPREDTMTDKRNSADNEAIDAEFTVVGERMSSKHEAGGTIISVSRPQKFCLLFACALVIITVFYPPWLYTTETFKTLRDGRSRRDPIVGERVQHQSHLEYSFVFAPPVGSSVRDVRVGVSILLCEWMGIGVLTALLFFYVDKIRGIWAKIPWLNSKEPSIKAQEVPPPTHEGNERVRGEDIVRLNKAGYSYRDLPPNPTKADVERLLRRAMR